MSRDSKANNGEPVQYTNVRIVISLQFSKYRVSSVV